jgi:hypothetical protein
LTSDEVKSLILFLLPNFPGMQGKPLKQTRDLWEIMLADMPYELGKAAAVKVLMDAKFFPTVSEIRNAAKDLVKQGSGQPTPEDAWEEVMKNLNPYVKPKWSHPLIQRTVKLMGFNNLCHGDQNRNREDFLKHYKVFCDREADKQDNFTVLQLSKGAMLLPGGE